MTFAEVMHLVALGFEVVVAVELVVGLVWSFVLSAVVWRRTRDGGATYHALRQCFGSVLLLGLELLVAADLVRTVAVQPTLEELSALGLLVLIRTFLSFALEVEINGVPPWRRWQVSGAQRMGEAHEELLGPRTVRGSRARRRSSGGRRQRRGARPRRAGLRTGCPVTGHARYRLPHRRLPRRRPPPPGRRAPRCDSPSSDPSAVLGYPRRAPGWSPHSSAPTTAPPSITTPKPTNHDSSTKTMPIGP